MFVPLDFHSLIHSVLHISTMFCWSGPKVMDVVSLLHEDALVEINWTPSSQEDVQGYTVYWCKKNNAGQCKVVHKQVCLQCI